MFLRDFVVKGVSCGIMGSIWRVTQVAEGDGLLNR